MLVSSKSWYGVATAPMAAAAFATATDLGVSLRAGAAGGGEETSMDGRGTSWG